MFDANLRESRAAHRQLLAAHSDWLRAFLRARESLKHGSSLPADCRIDETFKRFKDASDSFRMVMEKNRAGATDLSMTECSFASLSISVEILNRSPPAAAVQAVNRRANVGGVALLLAPYSTAQASTL